MANKLYIANLPNKVTEAQIHALFSQAGEIVTIELATDPDTRMSRGYGFVSMANEEDAAEAIRRFNKQLMGDRQLIVSAAIR
jgi:RNA recognition motif-containing protein